MKLLLSLNLFIAATLPVFSEGTQWQQTNGPAGGNICFLMNCDSVLYTGVKYHDIYRSIDHGEHWSPLHYPGYELDYGFIAMGDTLIGADYGKIIRSTDNGSTWTETTPVKKHDGSIIYTISGFAVNEEYLFANVVNEGILQSTDMGDTWDTLSISPDGSLGPSGPMLIIGNIVLTGGFPHQIYRSTDNGVTWNPSNSGIPDQVVIYGMAKSGTNIIATTNTTDMYLSADTGRSWTAIVDTAMQYYRIMSAEENWLIAGSIGGTPKNASVSTDCGLHWASLVQGSLPDIIRVSGFLVHDKTFFAAYNADGIYRSTDTAVSWEPVNSGIVCVGITCMAQSEEYVVTGTSGNGIYISADNGINWSVKNSGLDELYIMSIAVNDSVLFANDILGDIYRSTDHGANWVKVNNGLPVSGGSYLTVYNGKVFVSTKDGLFYSADNGGSWVVVSGDTVYTPTNKFAVCDGMLFAGSLNGLFKYDTVGNTLHRIDSAPDSICALAGSGNTIYAGTVNRGLYIGHDDGQSGMVWEKASLSNFKIKSIAVEDTNVMVVAETQIPFTDYRDQYYWSHDRGGSWELLDKDSTAQFSASTIIIREDALLAGSIAQGVWGRSISKSVSTGPVCLNRIIQKAPIFYLQPERSSVSVAFNLDGVTPVAFEVYTMAGKRVASVVDKKLGSGSHHYQWNYRTVASGVYTVYFRTGNKSYFKVVPVMW